MKSNRTTGVALAVAAAGMFALAPMTVTVADEDEGKVHCYGINSCKGKNDCKTANNACKGKSSCKGKGFLNVSSEEECEKAGGKVKEG
ncbi:BufA2 family periplasmic bufferin-type metallophore [Kaarinaea lacus]